MIKSAKIFLVSVFVIFIALLNISGISSMYYPISADILYLIIALFPVVAGFLVVKKYGLKGRYSKVLLYCTLGSIMYFIGEFLWIFYDQVLQIAPFPSYADVFYLLSYPFFILAIIYMIHLTDKMPEIPFSLFILSVIFLILTGYFQVFLAYDASAAIFENIILISYGIGDIIIIILLLGAYHIITEFQGGKIAYSALIFGIAFFSRYIADLLYSMFTSEYDLLILSYRNIDIFWVIFYLLITYYFMLHLDILKSLNPLKARKK